MNFSALPTVVKNLLIINVIMFLLMYTGMGNIMGQSMTKLLGLHYFASPLFQPWQLVTHMFMHGGLGHLALNMLGLFMLGPPLEYRWGSQRFLTFYMVTGIGAGLLYSGAHAFEYFRLVELLSPAEVAEVKDRVVSQVWYTGYPEAMYDLGRLLSMPMVGASGALYGVLLAFGMTYPNVELMVFPLFIPIKAKYFVLILGGIAVAMAYINADGDNVAHLAHLGGMAMGYVMIRLWRHRDQRNFWQ
ncbi:MAG: rhomboid family intramembrane serine protease [Flavobacteriales bacterium]|nr:rhomboid family intramembrane serine protease [Flavobacteriales bacterium]